MRTSRTSILLNLVLGLCGTAAAGYADTPSAPIAVVAHAARFDFSDAWGETVDWAKLDTIMRELAPDRLDWNALCVRGAGKAPAELPNGLMAADAAKFIDALAARIRQVAADKHAALSQNDWAIVGCAVLTLQQAHGAGQKYVTGLGDTGRLGLAITKLTTSGVNCGDGCVLTQAILKALGVESRFVGCHRKVALPNQPAGHAMVEYFESDVKGRRFGHIVDTTNIQVMRVGGEPTFRPPAGRFQIEGDRLARLEFLIANPYIHEQPATQGFDPPFSEAELAAPQLATFVGARTDSRLEARSVALDSVPTESTVPAGKSIIYKVTIGTDIPDGSTPSARMFRKGADGAFRPVGAFSMRRREGTNEVELIWDALLDGLAPGDYRADFYVDDGSRGPGYRRGGAYFGGQTIHYGGSTNSAR